MGTNFKNSTLHTEMNLLNGFCAYYREVFFWNPESDLTYEFFAAL